MSGQAEALRQFMTRRAPVRGSSHVTVVASGKGGAGTSTVATVLAAAAARSGASTLLVDAQESPGSLALLLGLDPVPTAQRDDAFQPVAPHLQLAAPAHAFVGGVRSAAERRVMYRRAASRFGEFQCVLVDAGSRVDDVVAAMTGVAGRLLMVTTTDRIAVAATYALFKIASERVRPLTAEVVVNRADEARGAAAFAALRTGAERFLQQTVGFAGAVPDDPTLHELIETGTLLERIGRTTAAAALEPLALHLMAPPLRAAALASLP